MLADLICQTVFFWLTDRD